jgi:hypothetical protein
MAHRLHPSPSARPPEAGLDPRGGSTAVIRSRGAVMSQAIYMGGKH